MVNFFKRFDKNKDNREKFSNLIYSVFKFQEFFTDIQNVNLPDCGPCVYAMWHAHQCCVHGLPDRANCNVLVSRSRDGQIIANVVEKWGFKVIHGSKGKKGSVEATLQMIHALEHGECCAIMVDGPRGPLHEVKSGAIVLAREANVPIVPVHWYSPEFTFVRFPSWDKMTSPVGPCHLLNIFGDPIYTDGKTDEQVAAELKQSLFHLEEIAPEKYKEAKKLKLWKKKRK